MRKLISAVVAATFVLSGSAYAISISGGSGFWRQNPSGWIQYTKDSTGGVDYVTHVDLKNNLHFSEKTRPFGWIAINGIPIFGNIEVRYTPMKFMGSGVANVNFKFGDINVNAKDKVDTELRANQLDIILSHEAPFIGDIGNGAFRLNIGGDIKVINGYAKVVDITQNLEETKSKTIPVPLIHVDAHIRPVKPLSFGLSVNWIGFKGNTFYDADGGVKVYPIKYLFVEGGYRYQRLKIDDISGVSSDIKFKGVFADLGFRF